MMPLYTEISCTVMCNGKTLTLQNESTQSQINSNSFILLVFIYSNVHLNEGATNLMEAIK